MLPFFKRLTYNLAPLFNFKESGARPPIALFDPSETKPNDDTSKQLTAPDALWLNALVKVLGTEGLRTKPGFEKQEIISESVYTEAEIEEMTGKQLVFLHGVIESLAEEFNKVLAAFPKLEQLHVTTARLIDTEEQAIKSKLGASQDHHKRCRATSAFWSLVLRSSPAFIDVFLVPSNELFTGARSETNARLRVSLRLNLSLPGNSWEIDLFPSQPAEQSLLMKELFKELVLKAARQLSTSLEQIYDATMVLEPGTLEELLLARQNLAQKLVSRHEELTHTIARDLHDVVIAELMLLKRTLAEERGLEKAEVGTSLETLSTRLREICYDLAPRDLEDWGLKTVVEDLLQRISKRIGAEFSWQCEDTLPELAHPVELHIYRIVQECLNNIAKYANATQIQVKIECNEKILKVTVADNGKGFVTSEERTRGLFEGGTGLSTINERAELIRCFHPATLSIKSDPGKGTTMTLEIRIFES